jgi:hypothetical protein
MILVAIINGIAREKVLNSLLGQKYTLPISGIFLSALVFLVIFISLEFISVSKEVISYIYLGGIWVLLTLMFEFGFGYFVRKKV